MIRNALICGALVLCTFPALADAPSKDEVAKARATCLADQARMSPIEHGARWCTDDPKVLEARSRAEKSCGKAMMLMVSAGLEPPISAPKPAPESPQLVMREKVQQTPGQPSAEFAQMEVNCPQGGTPNR